MALHTKEGVTNMTSILQIPKYIYTLSLICLFIYAFIHIHLFIFIHVYMYSEYTHLREVRHKYVRHACTYMHLYIYIYMYDMICGLLMSLTGQNEMSVVWYGMV